MAKTVETMRAQRDKSRLLGTTSATALFVGITAWAPGAAAEAPAVTLSLPTLVQTAQAETTRFDISPQPLSSALDAFREQSGMQVAFSSEDVDGVVTAGVSGALTSQAALTRLLSGTDLMFEMASADTAAIIPAVSNPAGSGATRLDAIIVTGERVDRSLRETGSSVVVVTGEEIDRDFGARDVEDLIQGVPNIASTGGSANGQAPTIRGQDSSGGGSALDIIFSGATPRATMTVDGRTLNGAEYIFTSPSAWDVEALEVFRGPQTTSQGANAIAGSFVMRTKDPTFDYEAAARAEYGNYDSWRASLMGSGPVIEDQVAVRAAIDYDYRDSFVDYTNAGLLTGNADIKRVDNFSARFKVLIEPEAAPDLSTKLTYAHTTTSRPQGEIVNPPFSALENTSNPTPATWSARSNSLTHDLTYDFSENFSLSNQFTGALNEVERQSDVTALGNTRGVIDTRDFSNELKLNYSFLDGQVTGVVGNFLRLQNGEEVYELFLGGATTNEMRFDDDKFSVGVFSETTYAPIDALRLTAGLRYQRDHQERVAEGSAFAAIAGLGGVNDPTNFNETFKAWLPKVQIAYDVEDNITVGGLVSRGYNPGGSQFAANLTPLLGQNIEYEKETVWNYELFTRASLLEDSLQVSANAFYNDCTDSQRLTISDATTSTLGFTEAVIRNAEDAEAFGVEISAAFQPLDNVTTTVGFGYLETRINEFSAEDGGTIGNEFERAPQYTANVGARWDIIPDLTLAGDVRFNSGSFSDYSNTFGSKIDPYAVADFSLSYRPLDEVEVYGYVNNAFNSRHALVTFGTGTTAQSAVVPRTFGFGGQVKF